MARVVLYARISRDPAEQRVGVDDQHHRLRTYAAERWPDAEVVALDDNDLTAADPDVDRPGYRAMLDELRAGDVLAVVAVEQSRVTRQPVQWEEFAAVATRAGITELHTLTSGVVSVAPSSRLLGRILAAVDAEEVERTRVRTQRAHLRLAEEGRPSGGRPYGYRVARDDHGRATYEVDPGQAEVVRRIVAWTLDGASASSIAERLDAERVPTPRGGARWRRTTIRSIISTPAIAGLRARAGVVVGPAVWEPIIDRDTWERVQAILAAPARFRTASGSWGASTRERTNARYPYVLSGLVFCGVCGWRMRGNRQWRRDGTTVAAYGCRSVNGEEGPCGGVSVSAAVIEPPIVEAVLSLASDPATVARLGSGVDAERDRLTAELDAAEAVMIDAAAQWGAGSLSAAEWEAVRSPAQRRAQAARAALGALPAAEGASVADVAARWAVAPLGERRRVVSVFVARVMVWPMSAVREGKAERFVVERR